MTTEIDGLRMGDKVKVEGTLVRFDDCSMAPRAVIELCPGYRIDAHVRYVTFVERPAPPPKVGDRLVAISDSGMHPRTPGTIVAIHAGYWWVRWDSRDGHYSTTLPADIERYWKRVPA